MGTSNEDREKLNDVNYDAWSVRTLAAARTKKFEDTILDNDPRPTTGANSKAFKAWTARQNGAAELLIDLMGNDQFVYIRGLERDAPAMWTRLAAAHESKGLGGIIGLWKKFHMYKYTDSEVKMKTHCGHIRALAERLGRLYNDAPSDAQIVAKLLSSLPPEYSRLLSNLDGDDENPKLSDIDYIVKRITNEESTLEEEAQKLIGSVASSSHNSHSQALAAASTFPGRASLHCDNCGKNGHAIPDCFKPGGGKAGQYPEWYLALRDPKANTDSTPVMAGLANFPHYVL